MKKIIAMGLLINSISLSAFANLVGDYKLVNVQSSGGSQICSNEMRISKSGASSLLIEGNSNLGAYFNLSGQEGSLEIKKINQGAVTDTSTNSSHGEKYETKVTTVFQNEELNLTLESKTKMLFVTTSTNLNTLSLKKVGRTLMLNAVRTFDEAGSSSSDWKAQDICKYEQK